MATKRQYGDDLGDDFVVDDLIADSASEGQGTVSGSEDDAQSPGPSTINSSSQVEAADDLKKLKKRKRREKEKERKAKVC
jgi:protein CMS1